MVSPRYRNAECKIAVSAGDWIELSPTGPNGSFQAQEECKVISIIGREMVLVMVDVVMVRVWW
jgi:hypothetical protein